jgi:hypothetical protein
MTCRWINPEHHGAVPVDGADEDQDLVDVTHADPELAGLIDLTN